MRNEAVERVYESRYNDNSSDTFLLELRHEIVRLRQPYASLVWVCLQNWQPGQYLTEDVQSSDWDCIKMR